MTTPIRIKTPLSDDVIVGLRAGDIVSLSGTIYTGRDAAHARMAEAVKDGQPLPVDWQGQVIYFVGPTPAKPGRPIGSAGPTTASRMDPYSPLLIEAGLKGMIGKGARNQEVRDAMTQYHCVYFGAIEGTAALLSQRIQRADLVAYEDLGPEAIRQLEVKSFPLIVINDVYGGDLYIEGRRQYMRPHPRR